ncbi:hypothetical protein [Arsenicicoccus sp. oral taxon 190]|uniref:hypothetical protein n=1 Tax=Arsenicicoccus sp. oral taxon 190 TaxID=1658671 RepID=UPI0012E2F7A8|nr:hypothetical protein [Arsenicicoccus sp. oral taxon 190]
MLEPAARREGLLGRCYPALLALAVGLGSIALADTAFAGLEGDDYYLPDNDPRLLTLTIAMLVLAASPVLWWLAWLVRRWVPPMAARSRHSWRRRRSSYSPCSPPWRRVRRWWNASCWSWSRSSPATGVWGPC